jgi:hypothetical protein
MCPKCGEYLARIQATGELVCWKCRDAGKVFRAIPAPSPGKKARLADAIGLSLRGTEKA